MSSMSRGREFVCNSTRGKLLSLAILLIIVMGGAGSARAAQPRLQDLSVGTMVSIGGQIYLKLNSNTLILANNYSCPSGQWIAGKYVRCYNDRVEAQDYQIYGCTNPVASMQSWDGCDTLAKEDGSTTVTGTDYISVCLYDERDMKTYEVRKFADGKCWMVNNLAYGGNTATGESDGCWQVNNAYRGAASVDNCTNTTSTVGTRATVYGGCSQTNRFGAGTYGNCRAFWDTTGSTVDMSQDTNMYGYAYDWAAAAQDPYAYVDNPDSTSPYGMSYTPDAVSQRRGICPSGWHLPRGGSSGDFQILHTAVGSLDTDFWQGGNWRGVYAGVTYSHNGSLNNQDGASEQRGYWWSSTWRNTASAYYLMFVSSSVNSGGEGNKSFGRAVRCLKD